MPDITMCDGKGCPIRNHCYRHRARPTPNWQSWFAKAPWDGKDCVEAIDIAYGARLRPRISQEDTDAGS